MFSATKDESISSLKNSTPSFRENNDNAVDNIKDTANKAGHKVREFITSAGDEIASARNTVASQIRTNPVQSSLAALGIGFVLGALFRR